VALQFNNGWVGYTQTSLKHDPSWHSISDQILTDVTTCSIVAVGLQVLKFVNCITLAGSVPQVQLHGLIPFTVVLLRANSSPMTGVVVLALTWHEKVFFSAETINGTRVISNMLKSIIPNLISHSFISKTAIRQIIVVYKVNEMDY
jgi:hypothetical protein